MTKEQAQNQGIARSWTLIDFARSHGQMSVVPFTRKSDGKKFTTCKFAGNGANGMVFCSFSEKLGELTAAEISAQKADLQVNEMAESGNFVLSRKGGFEGEVTVDLGI